MLSKKLIFKSLAMLIILIVVTALSLFPSASASVFVFYAFIVAHSTWGVIAVKERDYHSALLNGYLLIIDFIAVYVRLS